MCRHIVSSRACLMGQKKSQGFCCRLRFLILGIIGLWGTHAFHSPLATRLSSVCDFSAACMTTTAILYCIWSGVFAAEPRPGQAPPAQHTLARTHLMGAPPHAPLPPLPPHAPISSAPACCRRRASGIIYRSAVFKVALTQHKHTHTNTFSADNKRERARQRRRRFLHIVARETQQHQHQHQRHTRYTIARVCSSSSSI